MIYKEEGNLRTRIPNEAIVRVKECGNEVEIMYSLTHSFGGITKKIDRDNYVVVDRHTGEVSNPKVFSKNKKRSDSISSVKSSLKNLRDIINTNCIIPENCKWITLTYSYEMRDTNKLKNDIHNFNKRARDKYGSYEYISVVEPQGNGTWHTHIILIFQHKAPFMDIEIVGRKIWHQGKVYIKNIDNVANIAAYLTNYLSDMELDEAINNGVDISQYTIKEKEVASDSDSTRKKKFIKAARLSLYPSGCNIYRTSKGVKRPQKYYDVYGDVIEKYKGEITYKKVINISDDYKDFQNTIIYEYYKKGLPTCSIINKYNEE